ncbi:MAG: hybrid sensor histidine kinase/response regulator [Chloroflexi bacterium]|jgi:DNA-binding response OmpR family regulator|nr:hybrid sensor histidine kinase/response regulator [Chloroflexota bacterium]
MARLLVVDDDPQLLYSLSEYLKHCGHEVHTASSGAEALTVLIGSSPDLIVSDLVMDGMDGHEFHRRVRTLTGGSLPFLFLTAKGEHSERLASLRAGADDYIVKPFDPEELEARIAAVLARVEATRQQERSKAQAERSRALAEASEQLGDPVTEIVRELGALRTEVGALGRSEPREQVDSVLRRAGELEALVSDLSWADDDALPALTINREPQRIAPIVRTAAAAAARRASARSVELQIACGGLLSGNVDGDALQRALSDLLEAAVDQSPGGSRVRIHARRSREGGLEISITDGGRRADADERPPLDDPSRRALEGARHVVRAHGGQLDADVTSTGALVLMMWLPGRVAKHVGRRD